MSNEKQETTADIVADIRAQNQGLPEDSYALSPLVCDLLSFADRIEAAHQREVAELRERLKVAEDAISSASDAFRFCIENCELELSPKMIGKLCDDGQACERSLSFIREKGGLK